MGLETGTYVTDLVTSNPANSDQESQGAAHLRLIKTCTQNSFPDSSKAVYAPKGVTKSANYTVLNADDNTVFYCDATGGSFTLTLPAPTNAGWHVRVVKVDSSANTVTVAPNAGTISGQANIVLGVQWQEDRFEFVNGTMVSMLAVALSTATIKSSGLATLAGGATISGAALTMSAQAINEAIQVTLASAATVNIGAAASNYITISGTTTITAFDTVASGVQRTLEFQGALTLTYNATSLILPGAVNVQTAAGDTAIFRSEGSGNWRCISYTRAGAIPSGLASDVPAGFKNLSIVNNAVTPNTKIDLSADAVSVEDTSHNAYRINSLSVTIDCGVNGANGLDAGGLAASTFYSVWAIYNPASLTAAGLASLSATAPTMPAGYTAKARLGWFVTDGSSHFLRTRQKGRRVQYVVGTNPAVIPNMANGVAGTFSSTAPTWAAQSVSSFVPSTASEIFLGITNKYNNGATASVQVAPNNNYGGEASTNPPPISVTGTNQEAFSFSMELESTTIYWASSAAGGGLSCFGWVDNI